MFEIIAITISYYIGNEIDAGNNDASAFHFVIAFY